MLVLDVGPVGLNVSQMLFVVLHGFYTHVSYYI